MAQVDSEIEALGDAVDLDALAERMAELKRELTKAEAAEVEARTAAGEAEAPSSAGRAKRDTVVGALPDGLRTPEAVVERRAGFARRTKATLQGAGTGKTE